MVITTYRIPYKSKKDVIKIKPCGDIHFGSSLCDITAFKNYLERNDDDKTYFIGIGDLLDSIIAVDPRYEKHNDASFTSAIIDEQTDRMFEILEPYKDRIIGLGLGNHEAKVIKFSGTDPIARLCRRLGTRELGYSGLIKIVLRTETGGGRTVIVRYHHGFGGGSRTQGADLTKFSKDSAYWDADLFLYGHTHKRQADRVPRLGLAGTKLISRPKIIAICGTYLKTYSDNANVSYSELAGYPPIEVGGLVINIKPTNSWVDIRVDI